MSSVNVNNSDSVLDLVPPVPQLEERIQGLLQSQLQHTQRRNQLLLEATQVVRNYNDNNASVANAPAAGSIGNAGVFRSSLDEMRDVGEKTAPQLVARVAELARRVQQSASLAEENSNRVKSLHSLLKRVESVSKVVQLVLEMEQSAKVISANIGNGSTGAASTSGLTASEGRPEPELDATDGADGEPISSSGTNRNQGNMSEEELEKTVNLICSYQTARAHIQRGVHGGASFSSAHSGSGYDSSSPESLQNLGEGDSAVLVAKEKAKNQLVQMIENIITKNKNRSVATTSDHTSSNDKFALQHAVTLLIKLDYTKEAQDYYVNYITLETEKQISHLVENELEKINNLHKMHTSNTNEAIASHLSLVSQCLDTIAAAFEGEEQFMSKYFHSFGVLVLLSELHTKSTDQCVPVLTHFIETRKSFFAGNTNGDSGSNGHKPFDVRGTDQILEEMSHLVSCCHLYFNFIDTKIQEYKERSVTEMAEEEEKNKASNLVSEGNANTARDSTEKKSDSKGAEEEEEKRRQEERRLLMKQCSAKVDQMIQERHLFQHTNSQGKSGVNTKMRNNAEPALLTAVQDILTLYIPLQNQYFTEAFKQASKLQRQVITDRETERLKRQAELAKANGGNVNGGNTAASSALLSGLTSLYSEIAAAAQLSSANEDDDEEEAMYRQDLEKESGSDAKAVEDIKLFTLVAEEDYHRSVALAASAGGAASGGGSVQGARRALTKRTGTARGNFAGGGSSAAGGGGKQGGGNTNNGITLLEDVFFYLRLSFHRAMLTKSIQISSAVVLGGINLTLSEQLFPEIQSRVERRPRGCFIVDDPQYRKGGRNGANANNKFAELEKRLTVAVLRSDEEGGGVGGTANKVGSPSTAREPRGTGVSGNPQRQRQRELSGRALAWMDALERAVQYTRRLAGELVELGEVHFGGGNNGVKSSSEMVRFTEMAQDMVILANEKEKSVLDAFYLKCAANCSFKLVMTSIMTEKVRPLDYNMNEKTFFYYELHDPWAQLCVNTWTAFFNRQVKPYLVSSFLSNSSGGDLGKMGTKGQGPHRSCWDMYLTHLVDTIVQQLKEIILKKNFNSFGGLQIDKEIRLLKQFFLAQSSETIMLTIREKFSSLSLISSLLLAETLPAALEDLRNDAHNNDAGAGVHDTNRLSSEEKRRVLLNRVDFNKEEIMKLNL